MEIERVDSRLGELIGDGATSEHSRDMERCERWA